MTSTDQQELSPAQKLADLKYTLRHLVILARRPSGRGNLPMAALLDALDNASKARCGRMGCALPEDQCFALHIDPETASINQ